MKKRGILGGTFDPIHRGHLGLALDAKHQAGLDEVILLPNYIQPFKTGSEAGSQDRLAMIDLSLADLKEGGLSLSRYEIEKNFVSYTYDSLKALKKIYRDSKLYFIVGTDAFLSIPSWKRGEDLLKNNAFIVGTRPGWREEELSEAIVRYSENYASEIIAIKNRRLDISATEIRNRINRKLPIDHMVMPSVAEYIKEKGLYIAKIQA